MLSLSPSRSRLTWPQAKALLLYFAAWTPAVLVYAMLVGKTQRMPTVMSLEVALRTVGWAALLGLLVRAFAQRVPPPAMHRLRWMFVHLSAAAIYGGVWNLAILLGMRSDDYSLSAALKDSQSWIGWQLFYGAIIYALLAALTWKGMSDARAAQQEQRRLEAEALRVRTELEALRGRLDPHFLFNTLHSLTVLARHDPIRTEAALAQLAELLRYVLDPNQGAREQVRLGDELAFVQSYLALEGLRFGERLRVTVAVEDDTQDALVPSLLLQPLVENAIRHAVAPRATGGAVHIQAAYRDDVLQLDVDDDGPGGDSITQERPIPTSPFAPPVQQSNGLALATLRRRLTLLYGASASLETVQSASGFHVTVRVPA